MTSPPPNDDELDGLLDDAFEQFDAASPKQQAQPKQLSTIDTQKPAGKLSSANTDTKGASAGTNFEEEFARQLSKGMEDLLKESSNTGTDNAATEAEMKAAIDQLLKQMGSLQADLDDTGSDEKRNLEKSAKQATPLSHSKAQTSGTSTNDGSSSSREAQGTSFQDKIKATMDKLKESADRADAETDDLAGDMDVLDELMRQMDGSSGDGAQLDSLVDDVIGQLMSKE
ncbi:Peroxisome chaperone and import receptor, partial [Coemansia sp. RSA 2559]